MATCCSAFLPATLASLCCRVVFIIVYCSSTGSALLFRLGSACSHSRSIPTGCEAESRRSTGLAARSTASRHIRLARQHVLGCLCGHLVQIVALVEVLIGRFLLIGLAVSLRKLLLILRASQLMLSASVAAMPNIVAIVINIDCMVVGCCITASELVGRCEVAGT